MVFNAAFTFVIFLILSYCLILRYSLFAGPAGLVNFMYKQWLSCCTKFALMNRDHKIYGYVFDIKALKLQVNAIKHCCSLHHSC